MKIVFLLTHIPDPRINKRISLLKKENEILVVCTRRKEQNLYEPAFSDINYEVININLPSSKKIIKRYYYSKKFQKIAYRVIKKYEPDLIYCGSLDSLQIACKYKKSRGKTAIVYEIADLRETYIEKQKNIFKELLAKFIKITETRLMKRIDALIITSMKFFEYYKKVIDIENVIFMPNIPVKDYFKNYKKKDDGVFTVGFIGGIRYLSQLKMLVDASRVLKCKVIFAGAGGNSNDYDELLNYCKNNDDIIFTGKYDYKEQIGSIYSKIDCVYSVYESKNANVRIALPNKLYESILCNLPIIVAKGTYLSEIVSKYNIGLSVESDSVEELIECLTRIKNKETYFNFEDAYELIDSEKYDALLIKKIKEIEYAKNYYNN